MKIEYVEEMLALTHTLSETLIVKCMLFLMKENIMPMWEDVHNKNGGCFSYKLTSRITEYWRDVSFSITGKTLTKMEDFNNDITGISISPKKNFCILKIWMGSCMYKDHTKISILKPDGCIFKKH
jgi:translation initiation factor 4E